MVSLIWSSYLSLFELGSLLAFSSLLFARFADRKGRVPAIRLSLIGLVFSHLIQAAAYFPYCWWLLFVGRLSLGYFAGSFLISTPTFIMEVSPMEVRGRANVAALGFGSTVGAVGASVLGMEQVLGKEA